MFPRTSSAAVRGSLGLVIRPWRDGDRDGVVSLIDGVYREYGDSIFLEGADADLTDIHGYYRERGGQFVVLADADRIRGTHAVLPFRDRPGVCTFRRLYLDPSLRGLGQGRQLMEWAIVWAAGQGLQRVEFWSDTRFQRAHAFFRRLGFRHDGQVRHMTDGAMPYSEYFFCRELASGDA